MLWSLESGIFQETEREKAQDYLWNELVLLQSQIFRTVKGLEYTYQIRGNEMFVSRKDEIHNESFRGSGTWKNHRIKWRGGRT